MTRTLVVALALETACAVNPVTGKRQLSLVSEPEEIQLGQQGEADVGKSIGFTDAPKAQAYVAELGKRLSALTQRPGLPWTFHVVDDPSVNAFALPGGQINVTRGLLAYVNSEAELAGVVGHECGHVAAKHSVTQMTDQELAQVGLGLGSLFSPTLGQVAGAGMQLLFLKYSRADESMADSLGFDYMTAAGYDPRQMLALFDTLGRVQKATGSHLPQWLETHPDPGNRRQAIEQRMADAHKDFAGAKVDRDAILAVAEGLVFGADPRQGFFKGTTFFHPALKFQLDFPAGWKTQNSPQAVVGVSPQHDAALQLASAGTASPDAAAKQFFSQQGVQAGTALAARKLNGLDAVEGGFSATDSNGAPLAGTAAFIQLGGATWALVGFAPQASAAAAHPALEAAIASFRPLTDPAALGVQPAHVELVRVESDMTVDEFNQRHPSTIPVTEVAVINGLADGKATLKGGARAKRVTGSAPAVSMR